MVAEKNTLEEVIAAYEETGSYAEAGRKLGVAESNIRQRIKRAARRGYAPEYDLNRPVPEFLRLGGLSDMRKNNDGLPVWYKFKEDQIAQLQMMQGFCKEYMEGTPQIDVGECSSQPDGGFEFDDIIPWFNIGDGHLGMLSHAAETGENFDLKIGERELCEALTVAIERAPLTARCVIQDMGDMTHYETNDGVTMGHGHALDYDSRYPKMIATYARVMRHIIDTALAKYESVDLIINQGNHSRSNDQWMAIFMRHVYEGTDRLTVLNNDSVFIPYRMGNTFVICHHSDKCRPNKLADVMSTDFRQDFGEAAYKYIDIGHIHHRSVAKEMGDVTIESFNQLAAKDKYAHDGGWRSRSCLTTVIRSKTYGEKGRNRVTAEEVKDRIDRVAPGTHAQVRRKVHTV